MKPLHFPYYASALELNLISHWARGLFRAPPTVPDAQDKTKRRGSTKLQRHTLLFMTRTPNERTLHVKTHPASCFMHRHHFWKTIARKTPTTAHP